MKLDKTLEEQILEFKSRNPLASSRYISSVFGPHHKTVNRILKKAKFRKPESSAPDEIREFKNDQGVISLSKTTIHTLNELIEYCEIDLTVWEVERFICNSYQMGYKDPDGNPGVQPLYQVKAFLRRKKEIIAARKEIEELKNLAKENSHISFPGIASGIPSNLLLELTLPDTHFGKLAWGIETGHENYDVKIAEEVYWDALETLLSRVAHRHFDKVLYCVGNDILNSDDIEGRTTSGTYVSSDARYHKTFTAVRNIVIKSIERLRQIAPVHVIIVGGNHDQLSCWHLGDSVECYFHNYPDVTIDNLPRQRKYFEYGLVGLMYTHGHKGKFADYASLFAAEQPEMWGRTKFREAHTGHIHKTKTDEVHGFRTRVLPSLTAPDDWLSTNGFVGNLRNAEAYVWSARDGLIEQVYYTVKE